MPSLSLPCASRRPQGPGDRSIGSRGTCSRLPWQPWSARPPCSSPRLPAAASAAAASLTTTIGMIPALSAHPPPPLADVAGLWRDQSAVLSAAHGRGLGTAMRTGKEGCAGMLKAAESSSWLAGARNSRSPAADARKKCPGAPARVLNASRMVPRCGCTLRSMQREDVELTSKATRLSIQQRTGEGWEQRCGQARRAVPACSRQPSP